MSGSDEIVTEVDSDYPFTEYQINPEQIITIRLAHATRSVHDLEAPLAYGLENGKTYTLAGIAVTEHKTIVQVREKLGVWFTASCFEGVPGYIGLGQSDKAVIEAGLVNPTIRKGRVQGGNTTGTVDRAREWLSQQCGDDDHELIESFLSFDKVDFSACTGDLLLFDARMMMKMIMSPPEEEVIDFLVGRSQNITDSYPRATRELMAWGPPL